MKNLWYRIPLWVRVVGGIARVVDPARNVWLVNPSFGEQALFGEPREWPWGDPLCAGVPRGFRRI